MNVFVLVCMQAALHFTLLCFILVESDIYNLFGYFFYRITPIFKVSSVTGRNLDLLKLFFFLVPPSSSTVEQEKLFQQPSELQVRTYSTLLLVGYILSLQLSKENGHAL